MKEYPFVTAMIVVRNEEGYIAECFRSLLEQSYPTDRYEVLIVDGLSEDNTLAFAKKTEENYRNRKNASGEINSKVQVRYILNPNKLLASGWNLGIKAAQGDYVVRLDAHAFADKDFIERSVETMIKVGDAVCVGGTMETVALTAKGQLIAKVLSSPFGVGNSKFRYSQKPQYVDTVAFGLYKKELFSKVGYFDESLSRNQDNDMHRRIREVGGKFYLNPQIKSIYHPRETAKSMLKQGFSNGKWNIITFRKDPKSLSCRHLIPLVFVLGLLGGLLLSLMHPVFLMLFISVILIYFLLSIAFAAQKTCKVKNVLFMSVLFFLLHLAYGIGSLTSILLILKEKVKWAYMKRY